MEAGQQTIKAAAPVVLGLNGICEMAVYLLPFCSFWTKM
jgi:hypothetical protein